MRTMRGGQRRRAGGLSAVALVALLGVAAVVVWMAYSGMVLDDVRGRALDLAAPGLPETPSLPEVEPPSVPALPTPPAPVG